MPQYTELCGECRKNALNTTWVYIDIQLCAQRLLSRCSHLVCFLLWVLPPRCRQLQHAYLIPDASGISVVMMLLCRKRGSFARCAESCQCWASARTLFLPPCVLPLAALLLWEKQVCGCRCALCCNCWSPHSWLLQSDAAPGCGNICNCLGQSYWAGARDWNLPLLMPVGTSGDPPFHWWGGVPGEAALSLSDRWCGVTLAAACSSRSPVASNQLLYLTSLFYTHLLLNISLPKKKNPEKVSIPNRYWPTVPTRL